MTAPRGHASDEQNLDVLTSLRADGSRRAVHPADVHGRYTTRRFVTFAILGAILVALPWVRIGDNPALLLDLTTRTFFFGGRAFRAQDTFLLFFLVSGLGFSLVASTALFGRVWCGYACPQTVFVEGLFRRIERLVEGPATERRKLDAAPWTSSKIAKRVVVYGSYVVVASLLAHTLLGYFIPIRSLLSLLARGPLASPQAFAWTTGLTALFAFDFGWFREQFCIVMCPYGRLQSTMTDRDTIQVVYDARRGEPRGKLKVLGNGDCVDCHRCVAVCPTGIDIRQGVGQLECVGCSACVDACDEVMSRVGKARGLIRYDSENGVDGKRARFVRPRTAIYAAAGLLGVTMASIALAHAPTTFEATLVRPTGAPFVVEDGRVRNVARVHIVSKSTRPLTLSVQVEPSPFEVVVGEPKVAIPPMGTAEIPVVVAAPASSVPARREIHVRIQAAGEAPHALVVRFLAP